MWSKIKKKIQKAIVKKEEFPRVPIESEKLHLFFSKAQIKILDIGARGGPLKHFQIFAPYAHLFLCEPEQHEADRLDEKMKRKANWRRVTIIREALGTNRADACLHIANQAGLSSLLPLNDAIISAYYSSKEKKLWEVIRSVPVSLIGLDDAAQRYGMDALSIIKLDAQGTELDILRSGERHVLPSCLAVHVEMEEVPWYRDQPLIADVHGFLTGKGFRLIDMKRTMMRRQLNARPVFSKKEFIYAHALYVRDRHEDGGALVSEERHRLAAIACGFWFFDFALALLEGLDMKKYLIAHNLEGIERDIADYSADIWHTISRMPHRRRFNIAEDGVFQDKNHEW